MSRCTCFSLALLILLGVVSTGCRSARTTLPPLPPLELEPVPTVPEVDLAETAIRTVLDDVEAAMEQMDVYKILAYVSASYRDKSGRDYTDLRRFLQHFFEHYASIEIARSGTSVTIDGDTAVVTEDFVTFARGKPETGTSPLTLRGTTAVFLERIGGRWMIVEWGETS
jgi:hypothetical protein